MAQRQLDVGGVVEHIALNHAVKDLWVHIVEAASVLGVSVDDVVLQGVHRLHRVVPCDHDEIGGVQVHGYAGGVEAVQKALQGEGLFRARFNGEVCLHGIGIGGQHAAGLLHDGVPGMGLILRYHANVGGDHIGLQVLGQV